MSGTFRAGSTTPTTSRIWELIDAATEATAQLDQAHAHRREVRAELEEAVAASSLTVDDAWTFYWHTDVPVRALAKALGLAGANQVHEFVGPCPGAALCDCGTPIPRTSRTGRLADACAECRKAKAEQRDTASRDNAERRAAQLRWLKAMPYADYLRTDHWQAMRHRALRRAYYRCQVCNTDGPLDVHHRTYERRGHERLDDLTVLCRPCHARHHGKDQP